ncbi:hypothetical protein [Hyphomicrobium sp.]|uniref:hypothetical protein n=1 Tax=Hyphomicrobium sp. TaxID=82 RepID=UPI001D703036|nr:hypothetical protein [Hyphomicrobium sp.]MBY0561451.1 hypothetical protein [Hyphomicrobium sp.]
MTDSPQFQLLQQAMEVQTRAEADACLDAMIVQLRKAMEGVSDAFLTVIAKRNVGYFAGYYDHATRLRVEELYDTVHPFLGAAKDGQKSPEEIFELGRRAGEAMREKEGKVVQ